MQKTKLLYGTGNPAKLASMRHGLAKLDIEIAGPGDLGLQLPAVEEDGSTPLENARKKALSYYHAFGIPVFSCDSGLYIDNLPEELQPGIHVRRIGGRYLNDREMTEYYSGLARQYGDLTARYRNAVCLVMDGERIYDAMEENMVSQPFIITSRPHPNRKEGFPLDSLSVDIRTGKYYYDLAGGELEQMAVEEGFLEFFRKLFPGGETETC